MKHAVLKVSTGRETASAAMLIIPTESHLCFCHPSKFTVTLETEEVLISVTPKPAVSVCDY